MALHAWFKAGLCVRVHPFITELTRTYGFDLVHLHPRSVFRLNVFRWLCETVLNEPPSLPVFHFFFKVVIRPGKVDSVFRSVIVRFRRDDNKEEPMNMMHFYPISPSPPKVDPWANFKQKWFYLALSDPFYHTRMLPNSGDGPYPSLREVKVEKTTPEEDGKNFKIMQVRSKRSMRDLLEEMFMAGCFKMKNYSAKFIGLCSTLRPPERMKSVMTYDEAKEHVNELIGPYTEEEHRLYLADMFYGPENEEEGAVDQGEKTNQTCALPSPLPFSGSENTSEWLDSLEVMDEVESGPAQVVQEVQNLVRVAGYAPQLIRKIRDPKNRNSGGREALLTVRSQLRDSDLALQDETRKLEAEKEKSSSAESKLEGMQCRLEEAERNLNKEQDRVKALEKETSSQRVFASSIQEELVETCKQVKQLQEALAKANARAKSLEENAQVLRPVPDDPRISCEALNKDDACSLLSVSDDVISSRIRSCSQEVRSVLLGLKAKGLSPDPPKMATAVEACEYLSGNVKLLGGAAHAYGRTMATHTLAIGVSAVLVRGEGVEGMRGKLTSSTRAFYEENKGELTQLAHRFVVARDPNRAAEEGSSAAE